MQQEEVDGFSQDEINEISSQRFLELEKQLYEMKLVINKLNNWYEQTQSRLKVIIDEIPEERLRRLNERMP